jgi:hypothetical protein
MRRRAPVPVPYPLRLLGARGRALLSSLLLPLRHHSAQLIVLGVSSASLAMALHHSQWDLVAEVAEVR